MRLVDRRKNSTLRIKQGAPEVVPALKHEPFFVRHRVAGRREIIYPQGVDPNDIYAGLSSDPATKSVLAPLKALISALSDSQNFRTVTILVIFLALLLIGPLVGLLFE